MKKHALSGLLKLDGPLLSILSLLIAIVISGVIMAVCGYNPIEAFGAILAGSFGSQRAIVQTLTQATPLIFTGLAFAFAKKASLINLISSLIDTRYQLNCPVFSRIEWSSNNLVF